MVKCKSDDELMCSMGMILSADDIDLGESCSLSSLVVKLAVELFNEPAGDNGDESGDECDENLIFFKI